MVLCSLIIYGIIRHEHWTHEEMGLRHDNILKSLPYYAVFTALGVAALFFVGHKVNLPDNDTTGFLVRSFSLFIPISFFQEFAFRSFLIPRLRLIFADNMSVILVDALLFALIHVIYPNIGLGILLTLVSGIFFAWLYIKYPNLLMVSISHSILNIVAILLGFFNLH